jgi:hypothetical protein
VVGGGGFDPAGGVEPGGGAGQGQLGVPGAAVGGAAVQPFDGGVGGQPAGGVVERLGGQRAALRGGDAGGELDEAVEAAAVPPGSGVAPGADGHVYEVWVDGGAVGGAEAEAGEGAGPVGLDEDVGVGDEPVQGAPAGGGAQVEVGEAFAEAGVDDEGRDEGEVVGADP